MFVVVIAFVHGLGAVAKAADNLGQDLFNHRWVSHDPLAGDGDGLGPMHNATSCVACHFQGGPGGGGDLKHNVDLLSVSLKPTENELRNHCYYRDYVTDLAKIHPGFMAEPKRALASIVFHRFAAEGDYLDFRADLLGFEERKPEDDPLRRGASSAAKMKRNGKQKGVVATQQQNGFRFARSQRNTPALWGAGLIDSIPAYVIEEVAKEQASKYPELSGRVPRAVGGGVGRFGWRGQTVSLREFVLNACANELGLQSQDHPQPVNPLSPKYKLEENDLQPGQIDALVDFVSHLPAPKQSLDDPRFDVALVSRGERAFAQIGCGNCHLKQVGTVDGLYSDLLLHNLGPVLEDPVEPVPESQTIPPPLGGYSGGRIIGNDLVDTDLRREWRTPPLWGVASSAPYMHDGRAKTLSEAIELHHGEATETTKRYRSLQQPDRSALIAFLNTLEAP
ncbi:MAG: di-heme oxidoredictase family protein [Singulisphaera sp.]